MTDKEHINECLWVSIADSNQANIDKLNEALDKFVEKHCKMEGEVDQKLACKEIDTLLDEWLRTYDEEG